MPALHQRFLKVQCTVNDFAAQSQQGSFSVLPVWLAWHCYIARGARWVVPKAGKSVDPKTFESLGTIVLSNTNQYGTCRIAREISRVYWGSLKKTTS